MGARGQSGSSQMGDNGGLPISDNNVSTTASDGGDQAQDTTNTWELNETEDINVRINYYGNVNTFSN